MSRRDEGYAMVLAVAAMAVFAALAVETLAANRGTVAGVGARIEREKLTAAADAGLALAVQGLANPDRAYRWPIDGRPRSLSFAGAELTVTVEDERGKVPLNSLDEDQARRLFAAGGASGDRLDRLVDSFEDWRDEDDARRPDGAEADDYRAQGLRPRNGGLLTLEELSRIRGMDAALFAKLAPAATVFFGESGGFSAKTAQPLAIGVMSAAGEDSPDVLEREREMEGERTAIDIADEGRMVGRAFTVVVTATDAQGGKLRRATVMELTGDAARPYVVRALD